MATGGPTVAKAYVAIIPTTKGAQKAIADEMIPAAAAAGNDAGKAGGESLAGSLGSALSAGVSKVAGAAKIVAGAGVAALGALTTAAYGAFSDWEQLEGGVGKIFDELDISTITRDAREAYKTLGLSAAQYMEAMTNVGATFASTLGDAKGYDVAKEGMQAISDYASGTGKNVDLLTEKFTLITRASSSYQSIADQFSGILPATGDAFIQQAYAAGYLSEQYEKVADVPLAEYQEALTHMLTDGVDALGLLGNTAREADTTLSGSMAQMAASWQNFMTAIGTGSAGSFEPALQHLIDSVVTWLSNAIPRIGMILRSIIGEIPYIIETISDRIPEWIAQIGPAAEEALHNGVRNLANVFGIDLDAIMGSSIVSSIMGMAGRIGEAFGRVFGDIDVAAAFEDIRSAAEGALGVVGDIINAAADAVGGFIDSIDTDTIAGAFQWLRDIAEAILPRIQTAFQTVANIVSDLLWPIIQGIGQFVIDTIWPALQTIWAELGPMLMKVLEFAGALYDNLMAFINGLVDVLGPALETIGAFVLPILEGIVDKLAEFFAWLAHGVSDILDIVVPIIEDITGKMQEGFDFISGLLRQVRDGIGGLVDEWRKLLGDMWDFIVGIGEAIWTGLNALVDGIVDAVTGAIDSLGHFVEDVVDGIGNVVDGVAQGIVGAFQWIRDTAQGIWNAIVGAITGAIQGAWNFISGVIGWIRDGFWGLVDGVAGAFQSIGDAIMAPFSSAFEGIRSLWNSTIGGFGFDIPDWVPGVGGSTFRLPYLATGGELLTAGSVVVGERGPEVLSLPAGARVAPLRDGDAMGDTTYQVVVGDVDLSDDDQVRRVTREYLEYLVGIARPVNVI